MHNIIEIYTGPLCNYCEMAKKLFDRKNLKEKEIKLSENPEKKTEMLKRSNGKQKVPQIFINNNHIGGFRELNSLEISGKLDLLLSK